MTRIGNFGLAKMLWSSIAFEKWGKIISWHKSQGSCKQPVL